ncbi:MAG: hypothetical protein JXN60_07940 [Lentisphaerae bacterium]|nr:hypothetical protein [Lentisphaerota bacterium]
MKTEITIAAIVTLVFLTVAPTWLRSEDCPETGLESRATEQYASVPPPLPVELHVRKTTFLRFPGANEEKIMQFIGEMSPIRLKEYRDLAEVEPNRAMALLTDLIAEAIDLLDTREINPKLFQHRMKERELAKLAERKAAEARRSEGVARKAAVAELEKILVESFEVKQELIQEDVAGIEAQLGKLRELIKQREQKRSIIINRRLSELTADISHLGW